MSTEMIIGILATGWLTTIGWGIAWVVTVPAMRQELKGLRADINEMKGKIHDAPCQNSLVFQAATGEVAARLDERLKSVEHRPGG